MTRSVMLAVGASLLFATPASAGDNGWATASDIGRDTNRQMPTGSVPCHSSVTNRVNPTWWLR